MVMMQQQQRSVLILLQLHSDVGTVEDINVSNYIARVVDTRNSQRLPSSLIKAYIDLNHKLPE